MTFRQHLRRWWDNRISDWMEYEDGHPRIAAGISVALMITQVVTLLVCIGLVVALVKISA